MSTLNQHSRLNSRDYAASVKGAPKQSLGIQFLIPAFGKRYLEGPKTEKQIRSQGYSFTSEAALAWHFPSLKRAAQKARCVCRHMAWPNRRVVICDLPELQTSEP